MAPICPCRSLQAILFDDEAWNVMGDDDADLLDLNSDTKNKDVVTGESTDTANSPFFLALRFHSIRHRSTGYS